MKPAWFASYIVIGISLVAGCMPGPKKAKYTVEQYLADRPLMNKMVEECSNNPGELDDDPDCINAIEAAQRGAHRTLRDLYQQRRPASSTDDPVNPKAQKP